MMIATLRPLTYDDLLQIPDDGQRYEIIGGELIVNPAPTSGHQRVLGRLYRLIDDHVRRSDAGEVFIAPFDVLLGHFDAVDPDLLFLSAAHPRVPDDQNSIDYAPDLIVEVVSPSSRKIDRIRKMVLYAQAGVPEYWIADPIQRTLTINVLEGETYIPIQPDADGWYSSRALRGLRVNALDVFAELD
jgi:Uma2 family endonuclease